ncbi:tRNA (uracil-5-)-methyltransferase homolog A [Drosophila bipectinata]|uniref:tRNA (uracil-5-)-methyltransferase homolog A n=1 Tax=Drosophila bipectinata TaxID=42026 RepID=UPI001C892C77|nr:tRNA (uracil-5-)-methyltransferase homolog A [Drosophila bipectinata]XP_017107649.2 tRNA (uracil-5-)-methyltransferase homolog A [Drosophila bipectinata]
MECESKEIPSAEVANGSDLKENEEDKNVSVEKEGTGEEYAYLERNEFTSEIYKIEVKNLGYFGIGEFKKLLKNTLKLDMTKIKSPNRKEFAFVCFRTLEDQQRALETLNGYKWKGKVLKAIAAKASADPLQKKRAADEQANNGNPKKQRTAIEATCPLAELPYEDQVKHKGEEMTNLLKKYLHELWRVNPEAKKTLDKIQFQGVLPSPTVNGYRNKNEFTVGKNSEGEIVVGFRLGCYSDGSVEVAGVENLPHLPEQAKWAAQSFQKLVRQSKFLPFNPDGNVGHFRQLMVRCSSSTGELMLVAGIYSSNLSVDEQQELKNELKNFYENSENEPFKCTSLYYQDVQHREAGQMVNPVHHLLGTTHITDTIQGLKFRISPLAFFQINTEGANLLYQQAIDLVAPTKDTTLLDICCGTGTITLAFAKHCRKVMGVEIVPDAIKDAEFNAEVNGITNCKFYTGNSDDFIKSMVRDALYEQEPGKPVDLVAVVDPPRAGLHNRSIAAIRSASAIKRLVYVSCNPHSAKRNFLDLARPESKQYKGEPFYPKSAVAVDMFPHTTHTELIILFERETKTKPDEAVTPSEAEKTSAESTTNTQPEATPEAIAEESIASTV